MIYIHCGWPKTGTTTLQAALVGNQDRLAAAGYVYPELWRRAVDGSHNDLNQLLAASRGSDTAFEELKSFLDAQAGRDVLFSSESITIWLLLEERPYESLLGFLAAAREVAPVKCVWTLRRFDDLIHSQFLQAAFAEHRKPFPAIEFVLEKLWLEHLFARMQGVEEAVAGDVGYAKYDSAGAHNAELLRMFGLPSEIAESIYREMDAAPRLNVGRSHKQVAAVKNVEAISARSGFALDMRALQRAFDREGLRFDSDGPCVVLEPATRRELHERMLESARRCGFDPYLRFFGDDTMEGMPPASRLDADVLTDEDLDKLTAHFRPAVRA